jgi:hypothetical protein
VQDEIQDAQAAYNQANKIEHGQGSQQHHEDIMEQLPMQFRSHFHLKHQVINRRNEMEDSYDKR